MSRTIERWVTQDPDGTVSVFDSPPAYGNEWFPEHCDASVRCFCNKCRERFLCAVGLDGLLRGGARKLTIQVEDYVPEPTNKELAAELRKLDKDLATSNERHRVVQTAADRLEKLGESNGKG